MSDRRLRELERAWKETGSVEDRRRYEAARKRAGLPRLVIRHYVAVEHHGHCGTDGTFDIELNLPDSRPIRAIRIISAACSVELWPRGLAAAAYGWAQPMKTIYYTEDVSQVTCKTCLRSINKQKTRIYRRNHYAPGSKLILDNKLDTGDTVPVCGRDDSVKFKETYSYSMANVNCPACKRIMQRGVRAKRRPR